MTSVLARIFDTPLDLALTRRQRIRLGRHILDRALGDGCCDPKTNGEFDLLSSAKKYLRHQDACVFDIGANVGEWTLELCRDMSSRLRVYAFEPSRATFGKLEQSIVASSLDAKVVPVHSGLGDQDGAATLFHTAEFAGTNSLYRRHIVGRNWPLEGDEQISLTTGDQFCSSEGINHLDFVKIDTEGHELFVLRGFKDMLSQGGIDAFQFEYNYTWVESRSFLYDAFDLLLPLGYQIGKIMPGGVQFFEEYHTDLETFGCANYLAVLPQLRERVSSIS